MLKFYCNFVFKFKMLKYKNKVVLNERMADVLKHLAY